MNFVDDNDCVGPKNHLSHTQKLKFIAAASSLDPEWSASVKKLSKEKFMEKILVLGLQHNGKMDHRNVYLLSMA